MIVNIRSPELSCGAFAIDILDPESRRISVILLPLRPMMHPTISAGIRMFCVRRLAGGCVVEGDCGEGGDEPRRVTSPADLRVFKPPA